MKPKSIISIYFDKSIPTEIYEELENRLAQLLHDFGLYAVIEYSITDSRTDKVKLAVDKYLLAYANKLHDLTNGNEAKLVKDKYDLAYPEVKRYHKALEEKLNKLHNLTEEKTNV